MGFRLDNGLFNKVEIVDDETDEVITMADEDDVCVEDVIDYSGITNYRYIANQLGITVVEAIDLYGEQ